MQRAAHEAVRDVIAVANSLVLVHLHTAQSGCGGGGYPSRSYVAGPTDSDCLGGTGDGPLYVKGPFVLTGPDIYGLDRDGDGIACEPYDDRGL